MGVKGGRPILGSIWGPILDPFLVQYEFILSPISGLVWGPILSIFGLTSNPFGGQFLPFQLQFQGGSNLSKSNFRSFLGQRCPFWV